MMQNKIKCLDASYCERLEILDKALEEGWPKEEFEKSFMSESFLAMGTFSNDELIGYVGAYIIDDEAQVTNICIDKEHRNKGFGRLLINSLKQYAKKITLEVRKSNQAAIKFYEKTGFEYDGKRKNFYSNPKEDAILMSNNKDIYTLAIESSCDETACAVVKNGRETISSIILSQAQKHAQFGGVVPEEASRMHIENISQVVLQTLKEAGMKIEDIDAVCVTYSPGLIGALLVGVNYAKGLSYYYNKPLVPVHHIRGHIAANYLEYKELKPPFMSLVVSGGHSHIVLVKDYCDYEIIGKTKDDAAGEAFDKIARILGLSYPGGVKVDKLSQQGEINIQFPKVNFQDAPFDFSFSGVKTSVINYCNTKTQKGEEINIADVCASFSHAVCSVLVEKTIAACKKYNQKTLCLAGGVAANSMLRKYLTEACGNDIKLYIPPIELCGDNAAMIASQGFYEYLNSNTADIDLNAFAQRNIQADYI